MSRAVVQAIASSAPLIKVCALTGAILPCAFSAVTVFLKSLSFWMASAFLPSASFRLALSSLATRPVSFFSAFWPMKVALWVCNYSAAILSWHTSTVSAWAGEALTHISNERVSPSKSPTPILARTFDTYFSFQHGLYLPSLRITNLNKVAVKVFACNY